MCFVCLGQATEWLFSFELLVLKLKLSIAFWGGKIIFGNFRYKSRDATKKIICLMSKSFALISNFFFFLCGLWDNTSSHNSFTNWHALGILFELECKDKGVFWVVALSLFLDPVRENFSPSQAAQQGVLSTEHWETVFGTGTPNAAAEALVGSLTLSVQLPPPIIALVAGGL